MSMSVHLKRLLGVAVLSQLVSTVAVAAPTCVFVVGHVSGRTVTTPAIPIYVPVTYPQPQPIRVHVDSVTATILGYSVTTPEQDVTVTPPPIFVPAVDTEIPSYSVSIPPLEVAEGRCVNQGVTVPAVPVYIPDTVVETPGAVVSVPRIEFNLLGQSYTAGGQVIVLPQQRVVIPGPRFVIPPVHVETPEQTIIVHYDDRQESIQFLPPLNG